MWHMVVNKMDNTEYRVNHREFSKSMQDIFFGSNSNCLFICPMCLSQKQYYQCVFTWHQTNDSFNHQCLPV